MPQRGLCLTCKNEATCTYPKSAWIIRCEEFEESASPPAEADIAPPDEEEWSCAGLCTSCFDRETCTYPKPQGGVWHCDEYR